uniref:Uncharacterized protein n=1 Tax=Romanomermis culicivorax TaxID=13658 RepID=A0A915JSS6_ROMCU
MGVAFSTHCIKPHRIPKVFTTSSIMLNKITLYVIEHSVIFCDSTFGVNYLSEYISSGLFLHRGENYIKFCTQSAHFMNIFDVTINNDTLHMIQTYIVERFPDNFGLDFHICNFQGTFNKRANMFHKPTIVVSFSFNGCDFVQFIQRLQNLAKKKIEGLFHTFSEFLLSVSMTSISSLIGVEIFLCSSEAWQCVGRPITAGKTTNSGLNLATSIKMLVITRWTSQFQISIKGSTLIDSSGKSFRNSCRKIFTEGYKERNEGHKITENGNLEIVKNITMLPSHDLNPDSLGPQHCVGKSRTKKEEKQKKEEERRKKKEKWKA